MQPPEQADAQSTRPDPAETIKPARGGPRLLGDFEVRGELGRGGMGVVYEAWQRSLNRPVALKVLHAAVSDSPSAVARFLREAQAAANLHHPHIIPIYARGHDGDTYYYAMELVRGASVHTLIRQLRERDGTSRPASDLEDTVALDRSPAGPRARTGSVADSGVSSSAASLSWRSGVQDAQSPNSVEYCDWVSRHIASVADALDYAHQLGIVHRDIKPHNLILGGDGRLRVSDFGLARIAEQTGVTMTGEMLGSPLYMSREQIAEGPGKVDHRTDVYSLGATLYEWLTLEPPFPGDTRERVITLILSSDPVPPRQHNGSIPADLEKIVLKAMAKEPRHRYQTAGEFRDDLHRYLSHQPVRAQGTGVVARARKALARHQVAVLSVAAVTVAAALTVALATSRHKVQKQSQQTQQAQQETARILDYVKAMGLEGQFGIEGLLVGGAEKAVPVVQELVGGASATAGAGGLLTEEGANSANVGTPGGIAREVGDALYEVLRDQYAPEGVQPQDDRARILRRAFELDDPRAAMELLHGYLSGRPDDFAARAIHAALCHRLQQFDGLQQDCEQLVKLNPSAPEALLWRGLARIINGQANDAAGDVERARGMGDNSIWPTVLTGVVKLALKQPADALEQFSAALAVSPDLRPALLGRAVAYAAVGQVDAAVADVTRVLELYPSDADAYVLRAEYFSAMSRYDDAIADFERAKSLAGLSPTAAFSALMISVRQRASVGGEPATPEPSEGTIGEADPREDDDTSDSSWGNRFRALMREAQVHPGLTPMRRGDGGIPAYP